MNCVYEPETPSVNPLSRSLKTWLRKPGLLMPIAICLGGGVVIFLLFLFRPHPVVKPGGENEPLVRAIQVKHQTLNPVVTLYGQLETPRDSLLSSTVSAYVKTVPSVEGNKVEQGQLLVQLDDRDVQLLIAQRQAEVEDLEAQIASEKQRFRNDGEAMAIEQQLLALSQRTQSRHERLAESGLTSAASRDEAEETLLKQRLNLLSRQSSVDDHPNRLQRLEAQLSQVNSLLAQSELDLQRTAIVAPFAGRIAKIYVAQGNYVHPGEVLVSMYDDEDMEVRAQIPSRYIPLVERALERGQPVQAVMQLDEQQIALQLDRLASAVESGKAGVDGLFSVRKAERMPALGRTAGIQVNLPAVADVVAIPATAIYGKNQIYQVSENRLRGIEADLLGEMQLDGQAWALVKAPVSDGAFILATQLAMAVDGLSVRLQLPVVAGPST